MLSIVIPSYNEGDNIPNTSKVIGSLLEENKIEYEIIFVDDGSTDSTWSEITRLHSLDERIRGVRFSRNFGKESGILAGLEAVKGDAAVVMDCDLQHPPETIVEMYRLWQDGADVVEGRKSSRGRESKMYGAFSSLFYGLIQLTSKIDMKNASDFKLVDRRVIEAILALPERITFFRALTGWVGFETKVVYYDVRERQIGSRKWTSSMLFGYAIRNLTSFTGIPLYFSTLLGLLVMLSAVVMLVFTAFGVDLGSFTPGIIVLMLLGGVILECMGIFSYYISRVYEEVKHRPRFIVSNTTENEPRARHDTNINKENSK